MVFPLPESGKKVSFSTLKVRESQGITFLETRMNPVMYCPKFERKIVEWSTGVFTSMYMNLLFSF